MNNLSLASLLGESSLSLAEVMKIMDKNANGILFLVDENNTLLASITDGDIRRFLLACGSLKDQALKAANHHPKVAHSLEEAKSLYHQKNFSIIPILDEKGRMIDFYNGEGNHVPMCATLDIPVVINAGGKGVRLDPFTRVLPKPLIPVGEHPILELIMKQYQAYNCNQFHVIVNYKRELIKAYFADSENPYQIAWHNEDKPLGTGGGLSLLKGKIKSTFFFSACDALITADYEEMLQFHREHHNAITMICAYKNVTIPYGIVEMGLHGQIQSMQEKPDFSFLVNTGMYIVEPEIVEDIPENIPVGFPDIVERARKQGRRTAVFPISSSLWMDMGQLSELENMRKRLLQE